MSAKTYKARNNQGRTVEVTIPEDDSTVDQLIAALQENFTPEAVVAIGSCLRLNQTNNPAVDKQVAWLADLTKEMIL